MFKFRIPLITVKSGHISCGNYPYLQIKHSFFLPLDPAQEISGHSNVYEDTSGT